MTLRQKQVEFVVMLAKLVIFSESIGYEATFPPDNTSQQHMDNSLHYLGLAQDINLWKDGKYLIKTSDHEQLGIYWEAMGGSWGGRFNDGNHYSLEHNGVK